MQATSSRRLIKGIGANFYGQLVSALMQIAGVPILLATWGAHEFGEWIILFSIPAYLSATDLGFSLSAANDMTQQIAAGNDDEAGRVFQSLIALICFTSTVALIIATALLITLPLQDWFHFSTISATTTRLILWLFLIEALVKLWEGINHAGYRASGDYAFHVAANYTTLLFQSIAIWVSAMVGGGPLLAASVFVVVRMVATFTIAVVLARRHKWIHFGFVSASVAEIKRLSRPAIANASIPLGQALNIQGLILVVGAALGPVAVVTFSTLRTLTRIALQMVLVVSNAAEPELAAAYGSGQHELLGSLYATVLRLALWLALMASIILLLVGDALVRLWTHDQVKINWGLFVCLLFSAVASVLWYGALGALKASNTHVRISIFFCLSSLAAVVITAVALIASHNLTYAGTGLLLMDMAMMAFAFTEARRLLSIEVGASILQALNPFPLFSLPLTHFNKT